MTVTKAPETSLNIKPATTNWLKFAQVCRESFDTCTFQKALIDQCGSSEDIAWAVYFHLGEGSLDWLDRNIPALAGAKPAELIRSGASDQVRECLRSMPC